MQIKITPLDSRHTQLEGVFRTHNYYYLAQFHSAGIVTEIKSDDDWLESEMAWVTRSEIPFITALRHAQLDEPRLVEGSLTPVLRRFRPFFALERVETFPSPDECMQLVYKYCEYVNDGTYRFYKGNVDESRVKQLFERFDYDDDFLVRAGSCLFKAYLLLASSHAFAEEIYVNTFIAFEAMCEHLISSHKMKGRGARNQVIDIIAKYVSGHEPGVDFTGYESEMRDGIRNNIIHPFRHRTKGASRAAVFDG